MGRSISWKPGTIKSRQNISYRITLNSNTNHNMSINAVNTSKSVINMIDQGNSDRSARQHYFSSSTNVVAQARNSSAQTTYPCAFGTVVEFY